VHHNRVEPNEDGTAEEQATARLNRLRGELSHTLELLAAKNVSPMARNVLEALKVDLEKKVRLEEEALRRANDAEKS
jgi:hypothetical protein